MLGGKQFSAERVDLPTNTQTHKSGWQDTQSLFVDPANFSYTETAPQEETHVASTAELHRSFSAGKGGALKRKTEEASFPLISILKAKRPVLLLFLMVLLAVCLKHHIRFRKEDTQIKETPKAIEAEKLAEKEPRIHESAISVQTRKRFEKIKELLPAAEKLAAAVGTAKSQSLVETVQGIVSASDGAPSVITDTDQLQENLDKALGALRKLHEAAVEHGNEISLALQSVLAHQIPPLDLYMRDEGAAEEGKEDEARKAASDFFIKAYQGVYESAKKMSERFINIRGRLLSCDKQFESEKGAEMLMDAALSIGCLRATGTELYRLNGHAAELKKAALLEVEMEFMAVHEETFLTVEAAMHVHQMFLEVAGEALRNIDDATVIHSVGVDKIEAEMNNLETDIDQAKYLCRKMNAALHQAGNFHNLPAAVKAVKRAAELQREAKGFLSKWSKNRQLFADCKLPLSLQASRSINEFVEKFARKVNGMNERWKQSAEDLNIQFLSDFMHFSAEGESTGAATATGAAAIAAAAPDSSAAALNSELKKKLLKAAKDIVHDGDACVRELTILQERMNKLSTTKAASEELVPIQRLVHDQSIITRLAWNNTFRLSLIRYLEYEVKRINKQICSLHATHLSPFEKEKYEKALNLFSLSKKEAEEANTIEEVFEALQKMRYHALTVTNIFYRAN